MQDPQPRTTERWIVRGKLGRIQPVQIYIVVFGFLEATEPPKGFVYGLGLVVDLGVLGLAVSCAALLARFRLKTLSILGVIGCSIVLLRFLAMTLAPG